MKKRSVILAVTGLCLLCLIGTANASLTIIGNDGAGNNFLLDEDLDLIIYDYTQAADTWSNQNAWAQSLSLTIGSTVYSDWSLPNAPDPTTNVFGTDWGYDLTNNDLGHLFYTDFGLIKEDPLTAEAQSPMLHLQEATYWASDSANSPGKAWAFSFNTDVDRKSGLLAKWGESADHAGIAVHSASPVPIPGSLFMLGSGLIALIGTRGRKKKA